MRLLLEFDRRIRGSRTDGCVHHRRLEEAQGVERVRLLASSLASPLASPEAEGQILRLRRVVLYNADLSLRSAVFPTLLNRKPAPSYSQLPTNGKHIGNDSSKAYLNMIIHNANEMLKEIKNPNIAPAQRAQDQAPAGNTSWVISMTAGTHISAEDRIKIVRHIIASANDVAGLVRRELCSRLHIGRLHSLDSLSSP